MKYLFDTDIVIDYLRNYRPTIAKLHSMISTGDFLFLSTITNLELHLGQSIKNPKTLVKIDRLFSDLALANIDVNFKIAGLAGDLNRESKIGFADALIASTAVLNKCTLVTRNVRHFQKILKLKLAKLE